MPLQKGNSQKTLRRKGDEINMINKDEKLEELCKAVSDHLFNSKNKYDPYTKVIITNSYIEVIQSVGGIPIKRYE